MNKATNLTCNYLTGTDTRPHAVIAPCTNAPVQ